MSDNRIPLYLFDFDGTLTRRDTLIEFIRFALGTRRLLGALLRLSPLLVLMKLRLYDNGRAKERLFAHCFGGMPIAEFDGLCRHFAHERRADLLRPELLSVLNRALAQGARVLVVSASIDNWVKPFFAGERQPVVVGTQIAVEKGLVTGAFTTPNCYGAEKVRRVQQALPDLLAHRDHYYITAYGDSRGDKEMLSYADEGHYQR